MGVDKDEDKKMARSFILFFLYIYNYLYRRTLYDEFKERGGDNQHTPHIGPTNEEPYIDSHFKAAQVSLQ